MIRLDVLGKPIIRHKNHEAKLYAKAVALLAYLALEGRTNRRKLAEMLWAGAPDPLNNLSVTRGHIIGELGETALSSDLETIALGADVWCDALEWQKDSSQKSWELYRGEFLQDLRLREWKRGLGEEFEEWVLETREQFIQTYLNKAATFGIEAIKTGALKEAVRWLEIANTDQRQPREDVVRFLMLVYVVLNQSELALKTFTQFQVTLQTFERKPSRETLQIAEICQHNSNHAARVLLEELLPQQKQQTPFVGREYELEVIMKSIPFAIESKSWITLIQGEPGMGKTTCMNQLITQLDPNKKTYLIAEGFGERGAPPWRAFDFIVRTLIRSRAAVVENLPIEYRTILARFLPDVLETNSLEPQQGDDRLLFHAIRHLLAHEERPTLLSLDDIQWVDETSLGLVLELLRKPPPRGIVIIATYRNTEVVASDALLYRILEWIERERQGQIVDLNPLQGLAIEQLAQQFGNDQADSTWMQAQSGGNALYLVEMLRAGYTQAGKIPPTLERLILNRVNAIPQASAAAEVLAACAILGAGATLFEIKSVSEQSYEETVKAMGILRQAGLLQQNAIGVEFNHSLTREATLKNLNVEKWQLLHLCAGRVRTERPELAATHYWNAFKEKKANLDTNEMILVSKVFAKAGYVHVLRGDLKGGSAWFERGLLGNQDVFSRVNIYMQRAKAFQGIFEYEKALEDLQQAEFLCKLLEVIVLIEILNIRATIFVRNFRDFITCKTICYQVLKLLGDPKTPTTLLEFSNTLSNLGTAAYLENKLEEARNHHEKALSIRKSLGNQEKIADSLQNLGLVLTKEQNQEAKEFFTEAISINEKIGNSVNIAVLHSNLGLFYWIFQNFNEAETHLKLAIGETKFEYDSFISHAVYNNLGMVQFSQGKYNQARQSYLNAERTRQVVKNKPARAQFLGNVVEAELRLGLYNDAHAHLERAFEFLSEYPNHEQLPTLHWYAGEISVFSGNINESIHHFTECVKIARYCGRVDREASGLTRLARLTKNTIMAKKALELTPDNIVASATVFLIEKNIKKALKIINKEGDLYEKARFYFDIHHVTGSKNWQKSARGFLVQLTWE